MLRCYRGRLSVFAVAACALLFAVERIAAQTKTDPQGHELPAGTLFRLGDLRWRHATAIPFIAFVPGNKTMLTASRDHVIRLWDRVTGKEIRRFESSSVKEAIEA